MTHVHVAGPFSRCALTLRSAQSILHEGHQQDANASGTALMMMIHMEWRYRPASCAETMYTAGVIVDFTGTYTT